MKTIHRINKWSFIITLLLYTTIIGGLLAQILLGCIQVIIAVLISVHWKKISLASKKQLRTYWALFFLYWISYGILETHYNDFLGIIFFVIIPMCIAAYQVFITYQLKTHITHYTCTAC